MTKGRMVYDDTSTAMQGFATDPNKCFGSKAAGTVLKKGAGGDVDIDGWLAVTLYPTADGQLVYNGDAAKVEPIFAGQPNTVVIHPNVTQIVPSVICVICGM